jgi:hypothetical protein
MRGAVRYTANVYVTLPIGVPNMTTTIELLDAAKQAAGCETDYQFGKKYSIAQSTLSNWRTGNRNLDDDHAAMFARILHRDEGEMLALCAAIRTKDAGNRARWLRVAALLAASVLPPAHGAQFDNNAPSASFSASTLPIMRSIRRFLFGDWLRLA